MRRFILLILCLISIIIFSSSNAAAQNIAQRTVSLRGSSIAFSETKNADHRADRETTSINIEGGYFIIDNLEFGLSFTYAWDNIDDYSKTREYTMCPYLTYHYPLDAKSSIYYGGGFGLSDVKTKYELGETQKDDGIILFGEIGWEFFINSQTSINIGFILNRAEYDVDGYAYEEEEILTFRSEIGLTLYF
ncbi:MAG: outer membrane beta-barrel protein [Deltaproteobacteria bacterium]|nr:outer membrane beta-barrel protein [Deltaproteobacteria bacterium]